jgi:uncharacterized delta-60 repeat protein
MRPHRNRRARVFVPGLALAMAVALSVPAGAAPPGTLDKHFGTQGTVVGPHIGGEGIFTLPKGGFLVTGFGTFNGANRWVVSKWTAKGKPDTSFGGGDGVATIKFPGLNDGDGVGVAQVANGKIVVGGEACDQNGVCDFAAARLKPGGKLDHTFGGGDGRVTTDFFGDDDLVDAMAVLPSGKIVLMGDARTASDSEDLALLRYKKNGTLDPTFGTGGKVAVAPGKDGFWEALAAAPPGRLLVAGQDEGASGTLDFAIVAFKSNGAIDTTFGGGDGLVETDFDHNTEVADAISVLSNGSFLVGGAAGTALPGGGGTDNEFGIAKYTSNGSLDTSFGGGDGLVTTNFAVPGFDRIASMAVQADGKIVAAGGTDLLGSGNREWVVARYLANGNLDTGFGTNGATMTNFTPQDDQIEFSAVGIEPKGRIVVSGFAADQPALAGYVG